MEAFKSNPADFVDKNKEKQVFHSHSVSSFSATYQGAL